MEGDPPCGIYNYTIDRQAQFSGEKLFPDHVIRRAENLNPAIQSLLLVGSMGSVAQNEKSDLDYTLLVDKSSLSKTALESLHRRKFPMVDNGGPFPTNWELSSIRASHVARVIISRANFSPKHMVVTGYGEYRPLKPNTSDDNRALNRRVEIKILKDIKIEEKVKGIQSPKLFLPFRKKSFS